MKKFIFLLISVFCCSAFAGDLEANKKLVRDFYELAFNQHKPTEAVNKYIGDHYTQHNPNVPNGKEVFANYFEGFFKTHPKAHVQIKRVLADGDLVVLHLHSQMLEKGNGSAIVDIFRIEKGKIVEHWDVVQEVPAKSANTNTMF